ncbi:uncharacterized protein EV420DRAFT_559016 [Desarmillaria tabescens]|uniref:Uncharacterized protein n=1 Tax=Armillaria tabescens TaxID=1929756 RepID=A0AA39N3D9_ARMTA|nr:uncharacterized protein EV420DRAFT_559016 [Desarmillaria tabescens]KAK0455765.1 hypothetical protein EV420DRAFT_559016 [Desarmillaria tabescens]
MDSHSSSSSSMNSNDSTEQSQDPYSEYTPDDPYLASDLQGRIFIPPDAFLSTILRLPDEWRTDATVRSQIDVISHDFVFQILADEYLKVASGTSEGQPGRLYDAMLVRAFEMTAEPEKERMSVRPHFLQFATHDRWLDDAKDAEYRVLPKGVSAEEDAQARKDDATKQDAEDEDEEEDEEGIDEVELSKKREDAAKRWEMSMRCARNAVDGLSMFRSHCHGLLLAPRKAQPLYYDRSAILVCEAFDIVDKDDQVTDIFIAMLLGLSAIPPDSGVLPILSMK